MGNNKMKTKFPFNCLMSEELQIKLRDYAAIGKKHRKNFSQAILVEWALLKFFNYLEENEVEEQLKRIVEIEKTDGLEMALWISKKTFEI